MTKFLIEVDLTADERNKTDDIDLSLGSALADYVADRPGAIWVGDNRYLVGAARYVETPAPVRTRSKPTGVAFETAPTAKPTRKKAATKAAPAFSAETE